MNVVILLVLYLCSMVFYGISTFTELRDVSTGFGRGLCAVEEGWRSSFVLH